MIDFEKVFGIPSFLNIANRYRKTKARFIEIYENNNGRQSPRAITDLYRKRLSDDLLTLGFGPAVSVLIEKIDQLEKKIEKLQVEVDNLTPQEDSSRTS